MSYSDFTIDDLKQKLGLRLIQGESLFSTIAPYTVSTTLNNYIATYKPLALAIDTEKARSGYIIAPLLGELKITHWQQKCGAEMVAAQIYNKSKQHPKELVYGCVSTGTNWKFLKLQQHNLIIDMDEYYIDKPEKIMGILMYMCLG